MKKEFIEPEVEVVEFEVEDISTTIVTESGWVYDPDDPWK